MTIEELIIWVKKLRQKEESLGKKMFMKKIPDYWMDPPGPKFRCPNNHVSKVVLKSEEFGDLCLECHANLVMTFPEDINGSIPEDKM